jgi:hypothetical protein
MRNTAIAIAGVLAAMWAATYQVPGQEFVIDQTKPYVYIRFDHEGTRVPVLEGESTKGLWLRLVNNCRVPISVLSNDTRTQNAGVVINYEVVANDGGPVPKLVGPGSSSSEQSETKPPGGYSFHVGSRTVIAPGETLLFSVPANQVNPSWFVRATFKLEPNKNRVPQPSSEVDFTWNDIPKQFR